MRKDKYIKIAVTEMEKCIIRNKAAKLNINVSEYLRGLAMEYPISHKLTQEEIESYMLLVDYSNRFRIISSLFEKAAHGKASEQAMELSIEIRNHLKKFK